MSQKTKYILNSLLWTLISTVISGALLQTFLLEKGLTEQRVGQYVSLMQLVQLAVICFFSLAVDKIKNIIKTTALSNFLYLPFFITATVLCFVPMSGLVPLTVCGVVAFIGSGLYNVLSYKLPYCIMDMQNYGKWTGISSIFSSVFMLLLTTLLSFLQNKLGYLPAMRYFFPLASLGAVLFIITTASYRSTEISIPEKQERTVSLLKYKPFYLLILPNLLRGFCTGLLSMAVTVGYTTAQLNAESAGILLIITQTVGIPANFVYTKLTGKEPWLIFLSGLGILAFAGALGFTDTVGFLVCYGVAYFCVCLINVSVPVLVTKIVDYRVVGQYNGWRMLLNTGGTFLASLVAVPLTNAVGSKAIWLFAGLAQAFSGTAYFCYVKKYGNPIIEKPSSVH